MFQKKKKEKEKGKRKKKRKEKKRKEKKRKNKTKQKQKPFLPFFPTKRETASSGFQPSSPSPLPHHPLLTAAARSLSSQSTAASDDPSDLARSISAELIKLSTTAGDPSSAHLDLPRHFSLHFSDVRFNTPLLHRILDLSPTAGRATIDLYRWIVCHRSFTPTDESLSLLVHFLGRRRDFKAIADLLRPSVLHTLILKLARARHFSAALSFLRNLPSFSFKTF